MSDHSPTEVFNDANHAFHSLGFELPVRRCVGSRPTCRRAAGAGHPLRATHGACVEHGVSLLLIADHMPFGGAVEALGTAMGVSWINGFAYDGRQSSIFRLSRRAGLAAHSIFDGRSAAERVDSIVAFTGSAFWLPHGGAPLIFIPPDSRVLLPRVAWQFSDSTASIGATGMLQGAALIVGQGRMVAAGEAAMFSAQRAGREGATMMGFNDPSAPQNAQFVLNVLHWLSKLLPES